MCNFTYMETQAPALPVTPLTDEQKADLVKKARKAKDSWSHNIVGWHVELNLNEDNYMDGPDSAFVAAMRPEVLLAYDAEVTRLSLLLEEERRESREQDKQLFKALSVLAGMWNQYCPPAPADADYRAPGHMFMSAGEDAEEVLEFWGLMRADETAIDCDYIHEFEEAPAKVKELLNGQPAPTCQRDCQKCGEELGKKVGVVFVGQIEKGAAPAFDTADAVDPDWFPPAVFDSREDYDASVTEVVARIKSGQIKARTPQDSDESAAGGAGVGLQGEEGGGRG